MSSIFGNTLDMTQKSLDYLWLKQSVTLNNIANDDTPGFKAQFVTFEDRLKRNLQSVAKNGSGSVRRLSEGIERSGFTIHETDDAARLDGNNVQVDVENAELVKSSLQYQYQIQSINNDFTRLMLVIKG